MTTTSSNNFTGLYGSGTATINPNTAYGNANVVGLLSAGTDGANTVGNITAAGNITTGGILTNNYYYANGAPFSGGGGGTYGNSNVTTLLASFGSNSISTTGNVAASYFSGDGSQLSNLNVGNIVGTYGNANVVSLMANFGSNTIVTTGNITGGNFVGSGVALTSITGANVTGTVANATFATSAATATTATTATSATTAGTVTNAAQANITSVGVLTSLSSTGNITGANINGNGSGLSSITGANVTGTVANATFATSAATATTATTATSATTAGTVTDAAQGNITSVGTLTVLGVTGNITGGNIDTVGQITATGNVTGGNIIINGSNIKSKNAWDANTTPEQARITVGTGYDGDYTSTYDPLLITRGSQLAVIGKQLVGNADTNQSLRLSTGMLYADLNGGTLTNTNRRMFGGSFVTQIGNGTQNLSTNGYVAAAGGSGALLTGNIGSATVGNVTLGHGLGQFNAVVVGAGSNIGNAMASLNQITPTSTSANVTTAIGTTSVFTATATPATLPTTVIGYYMPNSTATYGVASSNLYRGAANYYFLKNDDNAAQSQMGSLRSYTEFNYGNNTANGGITISKNNGQVQQITPTGAITSITYADFVPSASDGTNTDQQADTVTLIIAQSATPYAVSMPVGADYKYSGGGNTVSLTANSVTMISITAVNISGTTTYLTTISPEFV